MANRTWYDRVLRIEPGISLGQWLYDRISNNWDKVAALILGGGGMTYLSSISSILAGYGPVVWGAVGILSAFVLALFFVLMARARLLRSQSQYHEALSQPARAINPLDKYFNRAVINIGDFYSPGAMLYKDVSFDDCQIRGPGTIYLGGSFKMFKCEGHVFVLSTAEKHLDASTIVIFENAKFLNCTFMRITLVTTPELKKMLVDTGQLDVTIPG